MKNTTYMILTVLYLLLLAWGLHHNKPEPHDPACIIARGYGGPITMTMTVSDQGTITALKVLKHNETLSYIRDLDTFIQQFIGHTRKNSFILGKDIDGISGATTTHAAIARAVRERLQGATSGEKNPPATGPIIISMGLFLIAIIALFYRHNALRWAALVGGAVYFGIITHTMLSLIQIIQTGLGHAPSFTMNPLWVLLLLLTFITTLIFGRIYCGSLCPFAVVQEILFYLKPHKHPLTEQIPPELDKKTRLSKYVLLFLITTVCLVLGSASAANIEPFIAFFTGYASKPALVLLTLMLIMAVFNFRFWCKYLCPVGALTSLIAAFSLKKIRPSGHCTSCGICREICPTRAISTNTQGIPTIDMAECIVCAKCLRACPENALKLGCCHEKK